VPVLPVPKNVSVRSYLFAPGNDERLLGKVFAAGADAVVLDLEDAVPVTEKATARRRVAAALAREASSTWPRAWVRLNVLSGNHWREDVAAVVGPGLAGIRIPKAESTARLHALDEVLLETEERAGLVSGSVSLSCWIESAAGALAAFELASSPRVAHLGFGAADFAADVGCAPDKPETTLWARSQIVVASRAAGIAPPVAPVYTRLNDEEGLLETTRAARDLGFFGRSCIHPKQIGPIHEAFTPTTEEVARGREILAAHESAESAQRGVAVLPDGQFVDLALVRRARQVVELADGLRARDTETVEA